MIDDTEESKQAVSAAILALLPNAVSYDISSSDGGHAGWVLYGVTLTDGTRVDSGPSFTAVDYDTEEYLLNLRWGAFGDRNKDTDLTIDVHTREWLRDR